MKRNVSETGAAETAVVPYIGTWIETQLAQKAISLALVVPYIGTWIETRISLGLG